MEALDLCGEIMGLRCSWLVLRRPWRWETRLIQFAVLRKRSLALAMGMTVSEQDKEKADGEKARMSVGLSRCWSLLYPQCQAETGWRIPELY